jgi:hypothetical protein
VSQDYVQRVVLSEGVVVDLVFKPQLDKQGDFWTAYLV